jgi:cytochrome c-type biogenesis protein CcmF
VQTNQTGIRTNLISNIYIALGEADNNGGWTVRMYYHPLAPWLWIGGFTMAFGGFVSLSDRRLRVGVPKLARVRGVRIRPAQEVLAT